MTETNSSLEAIATILDAAAARAPYKHTVLNEIFNAAFWDVNAGVYAAPLTMEEIELRFNRVVLGLSMLFEVPAPGKDGMPGLRTVEAEKSAVQEQLCAFYSAPSNFTEDEIERMGDRATKQPNFEDVPDWWPSVQEIREGILQQLGAVKVGAIPTGQPGSLKFSLNLPALERLIGGDSAIEVELRKSIVQEFAKRHLTAVAKEMAEGLKDDLKKAVVDQMNAVGLADVKIGWQNVKVLSPEITREVDIAVKTAVTRQIEEAVAAHINAPDFAQRVHDVVEHFAGKDVISQIRAKVAADLSRAMQTAGG